MPCRNRVDRAETYPEDIIQGPNLGSDSKMTFKATKALLSSEVTRSLEVLNLIVILRCSKARLNVNYINPTHVEYRHGRIIIPQATTNVGACPLAPGRLLVTS